jgi:hypothetical protein
MVEMVEPDARLKRCLTSPFKIFMPGGLHRNGHTARLSVRRSARRRDAVIRAYGPERCLWTSCYPNEIWTPRSPTPSICASSPKRSAEDSDRKLILSENARKIWFKNSAHL